jgi:hypothetical protein
LDELVELATKVPPLLFSHPKTAKVRASSLPSCARQRQRSLLSSARWLSTAAAEEAEEEEEEEVVVVVDSEVAEAVVVDAPAATA